MLGHQPAAPEPVHPRSNVFQRTQGLGIQVVRPVRDARALLPAEAVPYQVNRVHVRIKPKLLSYWIPFVAGVGLMVGGMKTAGVPFLGLPQLIVGVALIAVASWDFVTDSGCLELSALQRRLRRRPTPGEPIVLGELTPPRRRTYSPAFRREAVERVRETGRPVAAVAREMHVDPSTLRRWVTKDRAEKAAR